LREIAVSSICMDGSDAGLIINQLLTTRDLAKTQRMAT
jgi:hypothetical protein